MRLSLVMPTLVTVILLGCKSTPNKTDKEIASSMPPETPISVMKGTQFIANLHENIPDDKNAIYSPTLLMAWAELCTKIGPVLRSSAMLAPLQNGIKDASLSKSLAKADYTANVSVDSQTIDVRVAFAKTLAFAPNLVKDSYPLYFNDSSVECFGMPTYNADAAAHISILYYENDSRFVVKLSPKDSTQEIILAMGFNNKHTIAAMIDAVEKARQQGRVDARRPINSWRFKLTEKDEVHIPAISFNIRKSYGEYTTNNLVFKKGIYNVSKVEQRIGCVLNEKGAIVESEAEFAVTDAVDMQDLDSKKPHPKNLTFNKPFLLQLRQSGQTHPYLAVAVRNTELMIKKKDQ